eukprot:TRINITY_DN689_c0_g2_i1.p2 TRINITY_DN689_c0_g2~~TRINITY_DN689_c0_g2_i1.p2  ORF type:complete len:173 (-),score=41.54 TRINITY_DN689_c0_g2_i1:1231-1749(-)
MSQNIQNMLSIHDVPNVLKIARQKAALGLYKESVKSYKHALHILSAHMKELSDPCLKEQWKHTYDEVKDEVTGVYKLYKALKEFHSESVQKENTLDNKPKPVPANVIQHFGGMPFAVNEVKEEVKEEKKEEPKKDPMVWDPPSPLPKKPVKKPSRSNQGRPPIKQKNKPTTA